MELLGAIFGILLSFAATSLITYGVCWGFGIAFTWKLAIGVWCASMLLKGVLSNNSSK